MAIPAPRSGRFSRKVATGRYQGYVSLQGRGTIAIPPELRKRYGLDLPGAQVEISEREDGVLEFRPMLAIPASQAWFWTEQWQAMEREADEDYASGNYTSHDNVEQFIDHLDLLSAEATAPQQ